MNCLFCGDCGWLCEAHQAPWFGEHTCTCGAAGAPCPLCNSPTDDGTQPRMPKGFKTEFDKKGWRH
jgi:hypothetical protein